jgi:hypothetical protein
MNKTNIDNWFAEDKQLVDKLNISDLPSHIWNLDENGLQDVFEAKKSSGPERCSIVSSNSWRKGCYYNHTASS